MKYILLVIFASSGPDATQSLQKKGAVEHGVAMQEFDDYAACMNASKWVSNVKTRAGGLWVASIEATCVPKATPRQ